MLWKIVISKIDKKSLTRNTCEAVISLCLQGQSRGGNVLIFIKGGPKRT